MDENGEQDGLFEKEIQELLPPLPEWVDFSHPDFPKYFQVVILDDDGSPKSWWQRLPEHLRSKFP